LRLLAYLWHLASSFGVVTSAGVRLDLPLTHALLAELIGARRPTVTTAFGTLSVDGRLERDGRSILLIGDGPPALNGASGD
jgi:CRP-like cAMP-binding protein